VIENADGKPVWNRMVYNFLNGNGNGAPASANPSLWRIAQLNNIAGLELYYKHRPHKPVVAMIYSHSHVDHFGGVRGVIDEADVKAGKVRMIAPEGFYEHAVSGLIRRTQYM
jgi:alkyl sulfatase BDS1-like metallo-beta-lactamase superfamily hydrolase